LIFKVVDSLLDK
jgi:hypothetical protein